MKKSFLKKIAPFLWSYDVDKMDADRDKKRIITNVLNLGTKSAVEELFQTYKKSEIKEVVENRFRESGMKNLLTSGIRYSI